MSFVIGPTLLKIEFQGLSAGGAISVPGLQPGDTLLRLTANGNQDGNGFMTLFEQVVSVADELQQGSTDISDTAFTAYLIR